MKKIFSKKYLFIFLGLLFLITAIPIITVIPIITHPQNSLAAITVPDSLKSTSTITMPNVISRVTDATTGTSTIINLSDKSYFVPNKSSREWAAFASNTPPYVSAPTCPDGICQPANGETIYTCPKDCGIAKSICGDGICKASSTFLCGYVF